MGGLPGQTDTPVRNPPVFANRHPYSIPATTNGTAICAAPLTPKTTPTDWQSYIAVPDPSCLGMQLDGVQVSVVLGSITPMHRHLRDRPGAQQWGSDATGRPLSQPSGQHALWRRTLRKKPKKQHTSPFVKAVLM